MKRFMLAALLISAFALPSFAVCSLTGGACSFDSSPSYSEFNPNSLNNTPRYDLNKVDTISPSIPSDFREKQNVIIRDDGYDASCQFGICLPGKDLNNNN